MSEMYAKICRWENLRLAHHQAARGKRDKRAMKSPGDEAAPDKIWLNHPKSPIHWSPFSSPANSSPGGVVAKRSPFNVLTFMTARRT
ncbi:MAG TPA: hypothetical protein VGD99_08125 [Anaerolineae bacterium]